ncbi:hypothetical protein AAVH_07666 [Aphelenchoides avenae]|nr:hypothetical protein AAVH_07666 [Aphelenchus avenae]
MIYSLLDRIAAQFDCRYEEIAKMLEDASIRNRVEQMLQDSDCMVHLAGEIYGVHSAGLTCRPVGKIFCRVHGLMLDEEYLQNYDLEIRHPELPCVISKDPNGKTYYFPMEIIDTMPYA